MAWLRISSAARAGGGSAGSSASRRSRNATSSSSKLGSRWTLVAGLGVAGRRRRPRRTRTSAPPIVSRSSAGVAASRPRRASARVSPDHQARSMSWAGPWPCDVSAAPAPQAPPLASAPAPGARAPRRARTCGWRAVSGRCTGWPRPPRAGRGTAVAGRSPRSRQRGGARPARRGSAPVRPPGRARRCPRLGAPTADRSRAGGTDGRMPGGRADRSARASQRRSSGATKCQVGRMTWRRRNAPASNSRLELGIGRRAACAGRAPTSRRR